MSSISTGDALWGDTTEFDAYKDEYQKATFIYAPMSPIDPFILSQSVQYPLENRIYSYTHQNGTADYIVDNCIQVRAPSYQFRDRCVNHWREVKATLQNVTWMNGAAMILSGIGTAMAHTNPFMLTICAVSLVTTTAFEIFALHKLSEASDQLTQWSIDPAEVVAKTRSEAYKKGFSFVFANDLKITSQPSKTGVMHPHEVQYLYTRYFPTYCTELLTKNVDQTGQWMADFLRNNPLSPKAIMYAYGEIPPPFQAISFDFTSLENVLHDIHNYFNSLKTEARSQARDAIDAQNLKREAALLPLSVARDHFISEAQLEYDSKRKTECDPERCLELKRAFEAQVERYNLYYTVAAAPIHLYFDNQIQQIRLQRDQTVREIGYHERDSVALYYPAARDLLQQAFRLWTQPYTYQPLNFATYNTFIPTAVYTSSIPYFQSEFPPPRAEWNSHEQDEYARFLNQFRMGTQR